MYCKKCGKEIPEDSSYCNHCGTKQKEISFNKLTDKQKNYVLAYIIWLVVNILLLINGKNLDGFFPFSINYGVGEQGFCLYRSAPWPHEAWYLSCDLKHYGLTEFIFYVLLIPTIIYLIFRLKKSHKERQKART